MIRNVVAQIRDQSFNVRLGYCRGPHDRDTGAAVPPASHWQCHAGTATNFRPLRKYLNGYQASTPPDCGIQARDSRRLEFTATAAAQ